MAGERQDDRAVAGAAGHPASLADQVRDVAENQRYELRVDDVLSFIDYRKSQGIVAMTHAEVPPVLGGRGVGTALVRGALRLARDAGLRVQPVCPFVAAVMRRHPEDSA